MSPPSPLSVLSGALKIAEVRIHRSDRPARGGLWARRLRMSEQDTGLRHAVASDVTRDARGGRRLRMSEQDTGLRQAVASRLRMSEQEMSEQDTGLRHAVASDVTRDDFDENLTFGEAGSSSAAKRWHSTVRSREGERSSGTSARHALHANLTHAEASEFTLGNNYVTTLPPLRAVGRSEDRRSSNTSIRPACTRRAMGPTTSNERAGQRLMSRFTTLPPLRAVGRSEDRRSSNTSIRPACTRRAMGPTTSNERAGHRLASRFCIGRHA